MLIKQIPQSMVYIFTGDGKGKTSAALGVVMRAICQNWKVAWVAWYKELSWRTCEGKLAEFLPIEVYLLGKGFYLKNRSKVKGQRSKLNIKMQKLSELKNGNSIIDHASEAEHKIAANMALKKAAELLKTQQYQLIICDELNNALADNLVTLSQVKKLIANRGTSHLILTGRNAHPEIIKLASLVTEMKKLKHPYDHGLAAVKGLDF